MLCYAMLYATLRYATLRYAIRARTEGPDAGPAPSTQAPQYRSTASLCYYYYYYHYYYYYYYYY